MSSAQDWYRRHIGGGAGTPPPPAASPSPYYVPQAYQAPPGYMLVPVQQQQQVDPTLAYLGGGGGHGNPWAEAPPSPIDTSRIPRGYINPTNFLEMAAFWRGGRGKQSAEHCPRCDGVLFRRFEGRREAAPLCESCGWNGLWDQGEHAHTAVA